VAVGLSLSGAPPNTTLTVDFSAAVSTPLSLALPQPPGGGTALPPGDLVGAWGPGGPAAASAPPAFSAALAAATAGAPAALAAALAAADTSPSGPRAQLLFDCTAAGVAQLLPACGAAGMPPRLPSAFNFPLADALATPRVALFTAPSDGGAAWRWTVAAAATGSTLVSLSLSPSPSGSTQPPSLAGSDATSTPLVAGLAGAGAVLVVFAGFFFLSARAAAAAAAARRKALVARAGDVEGDDEGGGGAEKRVVRFEGENPLQNARAVGGRAPARDPRYALRDTVARGAGRGAATEIGSSFVLNNPLPGTPLFEPAASPPRPAPAAAAASETRIGFFPAPGRFRFTQNPLRAMHPTTFL
jgi:hypothetical protein